MTRITVSTDSLDDLNRIKRIIADHFTVTKIKGPTVTGQGRMHFYIFVRSERQRTKHELYRNS